MPERAFHGVGAVISTDIAVPDHEREVHFYSRVLSEAKRRSTRVIMPNRAGSGRAKSARSSKVGRRSKGG